MVGNNVIDQLVEASSEEANFKHLMELAEILIAAIPEDRRQIWAGKIMVYLAQEALRSASQENRSPRVTTKAIHTDLGGNPNQEPSAWLSPIWKEIETRYLPEIEPALIEMSRNAGLDTYPIVVIAPDWALAWKEFGATIEINRAKDPDTPSTIHVSRYSATCPVCGWMVKLERGEPTHPKRIVGRCEENPREHVFSFDRATKQGLRLV